jgi:hypothetical protein
MRCPPPVVRPSPPAGVLQGPGAPAPPPSRPGAPASPGAPSLRPCPSHARRTAPACSAPSRGARRRGRAARPGRTPPQQAHAQRVRGGGFARREARCAGKKSAGRGSPDSSGWRSGGPTGRRTTPRPAGQTCSPWREARRRLPSWAAATAATSRDSEASRTAGGTRPSRLHTLSPWQSELIEYPPMQKDSWGRLTARCGPGRARGTFTAEQPGRRAAPPGLSWRATRH